MSNCVGSSGVGLPASAVAQHGVERGDHLAHDGDKDDLGLLAGGGEAVVECFEGGGVTAGAEGCHVEEVSDRHCSAVDTAVSPQLAAVEIVGRETDESGDLFAAHATELRQQGEEGEASTGRTPGIEDELGGRGSRIAGPPSRLSGWSPKARLEGGPQP